MTTGGERPLEGDAIGEMPLPGAVAEPPSPAPAPPAPAPPTPAPPAPPPVVSALQLFGASFDLLLQVGRASRPASFYVGLIVLGTVGPFVLAFLGLAAVIDLELLLGAFESDAVNPDLPLASGSEIWFVILALLAVAGILVASIESTALAIAVLGSHLAGRPVTTREAVQRSRMVFWLLVAAAMLIGVPTTLVQAGIEGAMPASPQASSVLGLIAAIVIQAPFVYVSSGIVLGGVGPIEAFKRSIRVFRARKVAGLLVTILPVLFQFVLVLGLGVGLDLIARVITALGLDTQAGTGPLALLVVISVMATFSFGTLVFTAAALSMAPQVVMFVGLTRATAGLDHVRLGGSHAVERWGDGHAPFRWLSRPMLAGFVLGGLALAAFIATFAG